MPVETKVKASTAAAAVSGLALWALGRYVFRGDVPDVVASWVYVIVPAALAFGAGYLARHTVRPGDPPITVVTAAAAQKTLMTAAAPEAQQTAPAAQPPAAHP